MRADQHQHPLGGFADVETRLLRDRDDLDDALRILDEAEAQAGAPLVDEAERRRLEGAVAGDGSLDEHHHAVLARREGACLGYAGLLVLPDDEHAVGDVALQQGVERCTDVLRALLEAIDVVAREHDAHGTQMWVRHASPDDVVAAVAAGYAVHRRLAVLGRTLDDLTTVGDDGQAATGPRPGGAHGPDDARGPAGDVEIRAATPDDLDEVVAVLDAAYRDRPEGSWTSERFAEHADSPWFRWEDLRVAAGPDGVLGVHWTKRRGGGTGEVYNLAVSPAAQGQRLGRRLLGAGLRHLAAVGCHDTLLWVDLANEAAVRLYVTAGFTARWEDVALLRHVAAVGRHGHDGTGHTRPTG